MANQTLPAPDWYIKLEKEYLEALQAQQEAEERIKQIKDAMIGMMIADDLTNIKTDFTQAIYTAPTDFWKFNATNFKKDYPELFSKYATRYSKAGYLQIKMK